MTLSIGDQAPDFSSKDQNGETFTLRDLLGKKVILYFYPHDNTPTCTTQACNLRDNFEKIAANGYTIIGVSTDDEKKHRKFIEKFSLPFTLIADSDNKIHTLYQTWGEKKLYGKTYMGTLRTTFLIDEKGTITQIISKVVAKDHTSQILGQ